MFKREEDETRRSSVQKSASGILSSLAEISKVVAPQTDKGGATITKNFESLLRQPPLTASTYGSYANDDAIATVRT